MSYFSFSCKVPAGKTKSAPYERELQLTDGYIHIVRVYIPAGSKGLLHGVICKGLHQLYPSEPSDDFHGDEREIMFTEEYEMRGPPYSVTFKGWSPLATYEHEMIVEMGVLPYDVLHPELKLMESIEKLTKWLGA